MQRAIPCAMRPGAAYVLGALLLLPAIPAAAHTDDQATSGAATTADPQASSADPMRHNARCDGSTDDSAAFQAALNDAARTGQTLSFHGRCVIDHPLSLPDDVRESFAIDGGEGTLLTDGNDLFVLSMPAHAMSGSMPVTLSLRAMTLENRNRAAAPAGRAILLDNARKSHLGANIVAPVLTDLRIRHFRQAIVLQDVGDTRVSDVMVEQTGAVQSEAIVIHGTSSKTGNWANNTIIRAVTIVGGYGFHLIGAIQGVNIADSKVMLGTFGVKSDYEDSTEAVQISNSYFEAYYGGIVLNSYAFVQLSNNSFDIANGPDKDWAAIRIGDPVRHDYPLGIQLVGNQVLGFGAAQSPPFRVFATSGTITGNLAAGLAAHDQHCMVLGTPTDHTNAALVVQGNACWAAGDYSAAPGSHIVATGNVWSGPNNDAVLTFARPPR